MTDTKRRAPQTEVKPAQPQLEMIWPPGKRLQQPPMEIDYSLRTYKPGDEEAFLRLLELAGCPRWKPAELRKWFDRILPEGLFFAVHRPSGKLAATAMATHNPRPRHPDGGELAWVAADPAHRGRRLGEAVSAAVLVRFHHAGYRRIYLLTDDNRLAAIKIYLKLGFAPYLFQPDMASRWRQVCKLLNWPFTPARWERACT
jgi:mycothiol synthase